MLNTLIFGLIKYPVTWLTRSNRYWIFCAFLICIFFCNAWSVEIAWSYWNIQFGLLKILLKGNKLLFKRGGCQHLYFDIYLLFLKSCSHKHNPYIYLLFSHIFNFNILFRIHLPSCFHQFSMNGLIHTDVICGLDIR